MKKLLSYLFTLLFLGFTAFPSLGQQASYFPDRLIIKYESEQELRRLQSKLKSDPQSLVQQELMTRGARTIRPLLSEKLRQSLRYRNLRAAREVLRIQEVVFTGRVDPLQLAAKISRMPGVAYAEPKFIRRMSYEPNDPQLEKFIETHNFRQAWDLSQGSREVIIAINDGGVGYTHPDLDDKLWVNQQEVPAAVEPQADQNGDGTVTSTEIKQYLEQNNGDYNGDGDITLEDALATGSPFMDSVDGDSNSYMDDLFGWDFWDSGGSGSPITTDNNPIHDATDHGTHVAGIAAAETDNGTGVAGAGFNATYMAVKTGGAQEAPDAIGFGFDGIIYAANKGADIINCSWGGGGSSEAEQDVIDLVTEMGALVVAASGNESNSKITYPAAYDKVLSVGSVQQNGSVASYSNYGYNLDVLATGSSILSTSYNGNLTTKTGTSMATPVVSGLASLLKEQNPGWSAERIGRQIRSSASLIYSQNGDRFSNRLGRGSIDAFRALDTNLPGIKIISSQFIGTDGEKLGLNEEGTLAITLTNVGNSTSGLQLQLQSLNEGGLDLGNTSRQLGTVATGDTLDLAFDITITDEFNLRETPTLRFQFDDGAQNYQDFGIIRYERLLYDILAANNVKTSVAADGTIGFTNPLSGSGGVGFIPRSPDGTGSYTEGNNMLFEGGLMMEVGGEVIDAVRAANGLSRDFDPRDVFTVEPAENGSGLVGSARFVTDSDTTGQAIIDLEAFAYDEPGIRNAVFLKYTIQNPSSFNVLENMYVGLFNDWDIGNAGNNNAGFSAPDSILYLSSASPSSTRPLAAVAHLGPVSGILAIDNTIEGQQDSLTFGLYDGFTDSEKSRALKSGVVRTEVQNTDASAVTASGPYTLNPGASIVVGFVYAFGDDLNQLRNQIQEARSRELFQVSPTGIAVADEIPDRTRLFQNFPNPFRGSTRIRIDIQQTTDGTLTVYDALGRKVRVVADREFEAGTHFVRFNAGKLSSGVYFVRFKTDQTLQTIPITHIK